MEPFIHDDVQIEKSKSLKSFNTLKVESTGDLYTVKSIVGLKELIIYFNTNKLPYFILGAGSNVILPKNFKRAVVMLDFPEVDREVHPIGIFMPSSVKIATLTSMAIKYGLKGWECLSGIPATLGGAIAMNAGTKYGEIAQLLDTVYLLRSNGEEQEIKVTSELFSYRKALFLKSGDIVIGAKFKDMGVDEMVGERIKNYLRERSESQPLQSNNCGCVFKNHEEMSAGMAIDLCGLKGKKVGGIKVSETHANFFEVNSNANVDDAKTLIKIIQEEVKKKFNIELELEAKLVDE